MNDALQKLHKLAITTRLKSYSPYSTYKVGAAIQFESGEMFSGCNVENASYGGTVCAERVAIWKGLSELTIATPENKIKHVVVVTDSEKPWAPCGLCRQVMAEFSNLKTTRIHIGNLDGIVKSFSMEELFPESFSTEQITLK